MARLGGPGFIPEAFRRELTTLTGRGDLREDLAGILERRGRTCTADDILAIWYRIEVDQRVLTLVDRARAAGVLTALATNQQSYRGTYIKENLPYDAHFDHQFHSFEVGLAKPDPAYFAHVVETIGVDPAEAVFVDDVLANVRGAQSAGLNAVHFAHTDTYGSLRWRLQALGVPGL
jgi:putative hydrolase of the HAD superfamily